MQIFKWLATFSPVSIFFPGRKKPSEQDRVPRCFISVSFTYMYLPAHMVREGALKTKQTLITKESTMPSRGVNQCLNSSCKDSKKLTLSCDERNREISHQLNRQEKEIMQEQGWLCYKSRVHQQNICLRCHGFITSENSGAKLNFFKYYSA